MGSKIPVITGQFSGDWLGVTPGGDTDPSGDVTPAPAPKEEEKIRIESLTDTVLATGTVVEAVGNTVYVSDVSEYAEYNLEQTGWYVFARITAKSGVTVSEGTVITGAAGHVAAIGDDHVDVAVRFDVAAVSQVVTVSWAEGVADSIVFKATDLAVRNLDYRVTFYVYDANDFATWYYKRAEDARYVGTEYYTKMDGVYTQAAVKARTMVPADTYYTHDYVETEDAVFAAGTTYYTVDGGVYTQVDVTPGEAVPEETGYYVDEWTLTADRQFEGTRYYVEKEGGTFEQIAVKAGDVCSYYTKVITFPLPGTTKFAGTEYYTKSGNEYTRAAVLAGAEIPADTYYTHAYVLTTDTKFQAGTTYYTVSGGVYTAATVTVGGSVTKNKYYVDEWTLAEGEFAGTAYYLEQGGEHVQAAVLAGEDIPAAYYTQVEDYALTTDEFFRADGQYYTKAGNEYTLAETVAGGAVPADTYYEQTIRYQQAKGTFAEGVTYYTAPAGVYTEAEEVVAGETIPDAEYLVQLISWPQATEETFAAGETYYTCLNGVYSEADVTEGFTIPVYMVHEKVVIDGLVRNVTYRLNDIVDCPMEFVLPVIEDDCHGAWFELRCRHAGVYSTTLKPTDGDVKIATEHTQAETKGMNMINLHYTVVDGIKLWRFMNTHSSIPV